MSIADAAIWNLRVCDAVVESTPVDLLNADGKGVTKGIPVIFELVDQSNSHLFVQHDASSNLLHSSFGLPSNPHSSLLMCSHSQLTGNSEVQVMTLQKARDLIQESKYYLLSLLLLIEMLIAVFVF